MRQNPQKERDSDKGGRSDRGLGGGFSDQPIKAVLEVGYKRGKMYDWLSNIADEVILAHPQKVRAIADARIGNDAIDSRTLSHLLRADLIPEAHACS